MLGSPLPAAAKADFGTYFVSPSNNAEVSSPVTVKMGVKGLQIRPAGASPLFSRTPFRR
jgi:hypothetical protein